MNHEEEVNSPQRRPDDLSRLTTAFEAMAKSMHALNGRIEALENTKIDKNTPYFDEIYGEESFSFPQTPGLSNKRDNRRETMFGRQTRQALEVSQYAVVQAKQPDFSHIYLKSLSIKAVFKFVSQINEYLIAHRIKLPATTLVDEKIRRRLIATDGKLNEASFYRLETEDLFARLRKEIRPFSKLDFHTKLQKNVDFEISSGYKPSPTNFLPMYNALLTYRTEFLYVYELMSEDNEGNVPECKNKEGGLIKTFIDKIPFEYGKRTFQLLSSDQKYTDIHAFLKAFYTQVQSDHTDAQNARRLLQNFGGTEWERNSSTSLHAIVKVEGDSEEDALDAEVEYEESFLHAMEPRKQTETQPCFTKLLSGECSKTGCAYNHREDTLYKKRAEFIERMQKTQAAQSSTKPIQLLRRPGPEVKTSYAETTSVIVSDDLNNLCEELLLSNFPADWYVRTIHREGVIHVDNGDIDISSVLFDTGALTASYISADYVDEHRQALSPYLHSAKGTVRLAAHKHKVDITECALLSVSFMDSTERRHVAQIKFIVLPGSTNHMVIGWPAIVGSLSTIFLDMLHNAMNEYEGLPSHELLNLQNDLLPPWSNTPAEDAPEDTDTPLPSAFPDALHFMEMTPEEARQEYYDQIEEHVSAEFRNSTQVVELLKTKGAKVFVPDNWEGIKGIPPLELEWKADVPDRLKPRSRIVNPRLYEAASKELERLRGYFYEPSNSPVASCLVIAPKATKPFIRFCGDYVALNKYIITGHYPIPNVQRSLDKICGFRIFLDIDLVNAFHQVRLGPKTSALLSVQTPWGQFAPKFMPEGVAPATFVLQETVDIVFSEYEEWTIAIFDNLLILAHDYDDAYKKLDIIIDRCIERNVFLKFAKSWLGFDKVHFFGYDCKHNNYALSEDRKKALTELAPPRSLKGMQSFLGAANFFKSFVPNYSCLAAPLTDMTRKDFSWDQDAWNPERLKAFDVFKAALLHSFTIFYPNYDLPWILRTDASPHGVAFILFQVYRPTPEAEPELQPILIASQKFSPQARNWTTIEQEAYGVYFAVVKSAYYLRCKEFVIETDHANLQWMEASTVPKIMRWRVYLQSFNFSVRHIAGKLNLVADWLSRIYDREETTAPTHSLHRMAPEHHPHIPQTGKRKGEERVEEALPISKKSKDTTNDNIQDRKTASPTPESLLAQVHGGRMAHHGTRKTWKTLNEHFPGHRIPYRFVEDYVAACAICQKDRLGMTDALEPLQRSLHPPYRRKMVGVDTLTITPADEWGNQYINVVVVHATKLVALYPSKHKGAQDMALALFQFFSTYGVFENIISDPGSDLTSEVIKHLTAWYGIRHIFSLVDRHESNGVEGTNKSILRHLRAIVSDERLKDRWSDPTVLYLVQYVLNSQVSHETGTVPFYAHFGTEDGTYFKLPEPVSDSSNTQEFIRLLDANLRTIWEASKKHQAAIKNKRAGDDDPARQNMYQPGDLVLFQRNPEAPAPSKLALRYMGPYEVISQQKNDVTCRHLCIKSVHIFHVERLKIFHGDRTEAERIALLDHDQFEIEKILHWRGDPTLRTTMEFFIRYQDGDERWVTWSKDLFDSLPYEEFCRANPPLFPLIYTVEEAKRQIRDLNAKPITEVQPGDTVYVDLRSRGNGAWYAAIGLPRSAELTYVIECTYIRWVGNKKKKIEMNCSLTGWNIEADHFLVHCYGRVTRFDSTTMVKVDKELARAYPKMLPN